MIFLVVPYLRILTYYLLYTRICCTNFDWRQCRKIKPFSIRKVNHLFLSSRILKCHQLRLRRRHIQEWVIPISWNKSSLTREFPPSSLSQAVFSFLRARVYSLIECLEGSRMHVKKRLSPSLYRKYFLQELLHNQWVSSERHLISKSSYKKFSSGRWFSES